MKINIKTPINNYDVIIDSLQNANLKFNSKVFILTNKTIEKLHIFYLLSKISLSDNLSSKDIIVYAIEDGECYKNMDTALEILDECFKNKLDRNSIFICFGGGVVSDIGGFCASIYQRGVKFLNIPTTLLSCIDASVGGKTGINNKFGKNLIGSFYQPSNVYIDLHFLSTLDKTHFNCAMSEAIKMAVCFDDEYFEFLNKQDKTTLQDSDVLAKVVAKSVEIKAMVVNEDEKEKGIRAKLNYGHTFGHVIEKQCNYEGMIHSQAVGIGMVMANSLSNKLGMLSDDECDKVENLLKKFDIPTTYNVQDADAFYDEFIMDKKTKNNKINFILPTKIGDGVVKDDVPKDVVLEVLNTFSQKGSNE